MLIFSNFFREWPKLFLMAPVRPSGVVSTTPLAPNWLRLAARPVASVAAGAATAALPALPPSLQLLVAGALFGIPAIRLLSRYGGPLLGAPRVDPAELESSPDGVTNLALGIYEQAVDGPRSLGVVVGVAGALTLYGGGTAVAATAFALAFAAHRDRTGRIEGGLLEHISRTGSLILPERWRHHEAVALGPLGVEVPSVIPPEDLVQGPFPDYAAGVPSRPSWRANLSGLWETLKFVAKARRTHSRVVGWRETFRSRLQSLLPRRHATADERYLKAVDPLIRQWALQYAEANRMTLRFEGVEAFEQIKGDPSVFVSFPHSSIYPDFLFWGAFPRARFVADYRNFHEYWAMRLLGIPWFLDVFALPFVVRPPRGRKLTKKEVQKLRALKETLLAATKDGMERFGISPVYYPNEGRVPRAYNDNGTLDKTGLYSNVLDLTKPAIYTAWGGTLGLAFDIAIRRKGVVRIPIIHTDGAGLVMPKVASVPPFIQQNYTGRTVTFRVVGIVEVRPDSNRGDIERRIMKIAKRETGIDQYLREVVRRWAVGTEAQGAEENFAARTESDERWSIIADRIRSIHPTVCDPEGRSLRAHCKELLLGLLREAPNEQTLMAALQKASDTVYRTQYNKFEEVL